MDQETQCQTETLATFGTIEWFPTISHTQWETEVLITFRISEWFLMVDFVPLILLHTALLIKAQKHGKNYIYRMLLFTNK